MIKVKGDLNPKQKGLLRPIPFRIKFQTPFQAGNHEQENSFLKRIWNE
jgi:hypothetical protein